ncbi:hypothetical protein [Parendozoicomonas haliclonae]|nr:hypothetical protein [Parendozoicomonas haliclonae]
MKGAATDLLTQTLAEHNIATSTEHLGGYRRVLRAMEEGRIAMTVGITRDKFPEGVASFSDTPLYNHALTILVKRDMVEKPQEIRDLLELKGAMPDQLAVEDIFGAHSPKHLMRTFTPNLALKMLAIGRVDYTIYPDMQDDLFVSLMNMEGQFEKLPLLSATIPVYVAFSNQLDCALPLDKINQTLTQAAASKQAQQTLNDSLYKWMNYQLEKRD